MTDPSPNRSGADRAREDRRQFPLRNDTWSAGMRMAANARHVRAATAARETVELAGQLAGDNNFPPEVPPGLMWSVRGEPRSREHFGDPHPGDFPGGLPLPPECPAFNSVNTLGVSRA